MKISISQPRYLPAFNYIQRISISDAFVLFDNVQHNSKDYENRNKVKTSNGPVWLSIPLQRNTSRMMISDLYFADSQWIEKHKKTIFLNYSKAPFFDLDMLDWLYDFEKQNEYSFVAVCESMLKKHLQLLNVKTPIYKATEMNLFCKKDALLAEITQYLKGDTYISGPNGRKYINKDNFNGINILFHEYNFPVYPQLWGTFVPWMSTLDIIYNLGLDEAKNMLFNNYLLLES